MPWNTKSKNRFPEMKPKKKYGPKPKIKRVKPSEVGIPKIKRVKPKDMPKVKIKPKPKKRKFKQTKTMKKV